MATWIECEVFDNKEANAHIDRWQSAKCSNCGTYHTTPYMYYFKKFKFCPNCGAAMREVEK